MIPKGSTPWCRKSERCTVFRSAGFAISEKEPKAKQKSLGCSSWTGSKAWETLGADVAAKTQVWTQRGLLIGEETEDWASDIAQPQFEFCATASARSWLRDLGARGIDLVKLGKKSGGRSVGGSAFSATFFIKKSCYKTSKLGPQTTPTAPMTMWDELAGVWLKLKLMESQQEVLATGQKFLEADVFAVILWSTMDTRCLEHGRYLPLYLPCSSPFQIPKDAWIAVAGADGVDVEERSQPNSHVVAELTQPPWISEVI